MSGIPRHGQTGRGTDWEDNEGDGLGDGKISEQRTTPPYVKLRLQRLHKSLLPLYFFFTPHRVSFFRAASAGTSLAPSSFTARPCAGPLGHPEREGTGMTLSAGEKD